MNADVLAALHKLGLGRGQSVQAMVQLTGGVSSDIWRIDFADHSICAKRALSQLKVAAHWEAPLSRNAYEYAWYQVVGPLFGQHVPTMLGRDEDSGLFFMSYLEPEKHPVWKSLLLKGHIEPEFAQSVGACLGQMHRHSAAHPELAEKFKSDVEFFSLRLEPYLLATAQQHPTLASQLQSICEQTAQTRLALVHGDISPKNILCGPNGPVFLDAECAWYGDPAFDLAFCLNHLLLKAVWMPQHASVLAQSYQQMVSAYMPAVNWENASVFEKRTAQLLPALLLARVDGKSPVEYLTAPAQRAVVRHAAMQGLQSSPLELNQFLEITLKALSI
ncbi:MAG: aminoglycoside phosphotransferase family protein [Betaproteobacteria bacterium]|jgi:aminoglycoside phosphotransferase (APT) family kinase protein|nr:aminoglycoside phosphotransferase family protein [Betaproteobacteria bacterium]